MKLENQVCSLELAQQLKALGVKQESLFIWFKPKITRDCPKVWYGDVVNRDNSNYEVYSAFTASELGLLLPTWINEMSLTCFQCTRDGWWIEYNDGRGRKSDFSTWSQTETDARAKMLIHLIEQGLVKV